MLPDFDRIPGIVDAPGNYYLARWSADVLGQISFLQAVLDKWGENAFLTTHPPGDGYPGYLQVSLNGKPGTAAFQRTGSEAMCYTTFGGSHDT